MGGGEGGRGGRKIWTPSAPPEKSLACLRQLLAPGDVLREYSVRRRKRQPSTHVQMYQDALDSRNTQSNDVQHRPPPPRHPRPRTTPQRVSITKMSSCCEDPAPCLRYQQTRHTLSKVQYFTNIIKIARKTFVRPKKKSAGAQPQLAHSNHCPNTKHTSPM